MSTHYTAVIGITQVIETEETKGAYERDNKASSRVVVDVAHVVVRAETIVALVDKVTAHIALL